MAAPRATRAPRTAITIRPQPGPQEAFLASPADIAIYGGAAGGGKLLPLDTEIPTPGGFVSMADVFVGCQVFDENGSVFRVTRVFDIEDSPDLIRFTFDDGSTMDSCVDHQWLTLTAKDLSSMTRTDLAWRLARREKRASRIGGRKSDAFVSAVSEANTARADAIPQAVITGTVKTTAEIFATLRTKSGRTNHAIPVAGALCLPDADLLVPPYVLGAWLGDGTMDSGGFTGVDTEICDEICASGYLMTHRSDNKTHCILGLIGRLKTLGVASEKHIPASYLRANRGQRLALLQGLMDTDGTVCRISGSVEFCNTNRRLAFDVAELVCSLGWKCVPREGRAKLYGRDCGPKWTLKFTPTDTCFRLPRKAKMQRLATRRTTKLRYIVDAAPIASRPGRCISVDSASRLYLAGRNMIPTHNSWALLIEPLRHALGNKEFGAVIFRRTVPQIRNEGALWDESMKLYGPIGGKPKSHTLEWAFKGGGSISMSSLQYDDDVLQWQGSQIACILFDELTHFTSRQFWYMLSRNRSMCGVRPYVRATCNPDPDSFVAKLVEWWIDQDTGYAIPERSGVLRWFVRINDKLVWASDPATLEAQHPDACWQEVDGERVKIGPKSLTFIAASIEDNRALMDADPGYMANLNSLPLVQRERLKKGNWRVRDEKLCIYKPSWWRIWPDDKPFPKILHVFASWDTAFTAADQRIRANGKPPDQSKIAYSACTVWGVWLDEQDCTPAAPGGRHKLLLLSSWWGRVDWPDLKAKVFEIGAKKLKNPSDAHLIEKAASGIDLLADLRRNPRQCRIIGVKPSRGDGVMDAKVMRAYLFQPYLKDGYVWAPNKPWAKQTIDWAASFPGGDPPSADLADTISMAGQHLVQGWWLHHEDDELEETIPLRDPDDLDDNDMPEISTGGGYG